jgi:diguanylate cyclase (GGDEF)-like protein/PAS domain S-box-containing protein
MGFDGGLQSACCPSLPDQVNNEARRASAEAAHAATEETLSGSYRTVFDALDEAFCVIEMIYDAACRPVDYRFVDVNRAFHDHTGLRGVVGRTVREALPDIEAHWIEAYGEVARSGEPIRFIDEVVSMGRWFDVYAWPLGERGTNRVALHFTDVSQRKLAEDELRYRSEQFHALVEQAPIGVYLVDADLRMIEVNPAARQVFGDIPDLIGRDYEEVLRILWPKAIADEVLRIVRYVMLTGIPHHDPEVSGIRADRGNTEYYDWRMDRIRLPDGTDGVVCYFSDISQQIWARHALAAAGDRYRTLFESIDEGFCIQEVIFDEHERATDYRFVEINPAFERHTGFADALGRTIRELVPDIEPLWMEAYSRVALTGEAIRFIDHAESMGRWFDVYAFRIGEPEERKVAVLFNDISERKRAEYALQESVALLRHHAHHDALTGLPNRVMFEEKLQQAVAAADRHGRPFAVLFLDLDGFKAINDDLGHASGDVVLIEVARRLRRSLRVNDMLARIHGDEFVVILPEMSELHEAGSLAQKLLHVVSVPIEVGGTTVSAQASIGVALYPNDGANPRALLRAADSAMYQAKLKGKNGVSYLIASPGTAGRDGELS